MLREQLASKNRTRLHFRNAEDDGGMRSRNSWTGVLVVCLIALALGIAEWLVYAFLYDITQAMGL